MVAMARSPTVGMYWLVLVSDECAEREGKGTYSATVVLNPNGILAVVAAEQARYCWRDGIWWDVS